jgi:serine/threonine-protein kinase
VKKGSGPQKAVSLSPGASLPASASVSIPIPVDISGGAPANGFKIGEILTFGADRYEILGQLGKGGMGKVYKVRYLNNGEIQALKILLFDNPNARSRFVREAIAIRDLTQRPRERSGDWEPLDGVVGYKGFSETAGACYLFMEFLDGLPLYDFIQSLEQEYSQKTDTPTEQRVRELQLIKLHLFQGQFHTLGAVYEAKQIIHRDLKGGNVFVVRDAKDMPRIKIFDWGLAKEIESIAGAGKDGLTMAEGGGILGTPSHMPPEIVWAAMTDPNGKEYDPKNIGIQADMYSSGVMVYTSLVGRLPFDVNPRNFCPVHLNPQAPQLIIPDFIRPRTAEVLSRLLARYPETRPRDYAELNGLIEAAKSEISGQN